MTDRLGRPHDSIFRVAVFGLEGGEPALERLSVVALQAAQGACRMRGEDARIIERQAVVHLSAWLVARRAMGLENRTDGREEEVGDLSGRERWGRNRRRDGGGRRCSLFPSPTLSVPLAGVIALVLTRLEG